MAENTGATEAQAANVTQPQAGTDSPSQADGAQTAQAAGAAAESGTGNSDPAVLARENAELRREQAANRKRLQALEAAQQAAEEASLSELQKAQKRVADLERQAAEFQVREQERTLQLATIEAASRLGFRNPDLAARLLDRSEIEYGEDGQPKNVAKLLKALADSEPYLTKTAPADFGGGTRGATPSGQPSMNDLIRAAASNR